MLALTMASWRQHRRRYVATFLAIFLGVGFCAATLSLTAAARQGAADAVAIQYSKSDVIVYPASGTGTPVARISGLPDVSAVSRVDSAYVEVDWPTGHAPGSVQVSEIPASQDLRWQQLSGGVFPRGAGQVVVDANVAAVEDVTLGTRLMVGGGPTERRSVTVVGLTEPSKGADGVSQMFTGPGGLRLWSVSGASSELAVLGSAGTAQSTLAQEIRDLYPAAFVSTTDALRREAVSSLTNQVDVMGRFLQGFAVISLVVAGLVIANTFRIVMAQRIRDLALLRCVGAARWQLFAMSIGEAAMLGLCAAAVGTAFGVGLSAVVVGLTGVTSVDVQLSFVAPDAATLILPFVGGVVMSIVAAISPVWRAARVTPLAALNPAAEVSARSKAGAWQLGSGLLLGLVGGLLVGIAVLSGQLAPGLAGGILSFFGVLALAPIVVPASIRLAGHARRLLPRRWRGGVPATLSVLNATRNPRRTAATAGALLIGVTLISMMSVGAASISATESSALDRVAPVDLTISGGAMSARLIDAVRAVDGVHYAVAAQGESVRTSDGDVLVAALPAEAVARVVRDGALVSQLGHAAVVTVPVSAQAQVPGNAQKSFALGSGASQVRVTPVLSSLTDGPMLVSPSVLQRLGGRPEAVALYAELSDDADPQAVVAAVHDAIASTQPSSSLEVTDGFATRSTYDRTISVLLLVATALLGVAVLIALVGVGNTLSLSVLERTRENGLLRALGLTTRQLRLLLANEALLIAGSAAGLGAVLGVAYGWAGTLTLLHGTTSHSPTLAVPYTRLALIVVVAVLAGLLASVLPARRAVRLSPTAALTAD